MNLTEKLNETEYKKQFSIMCECGKDFSMWIEPSRIDIIEELKSGHRKIKASTLRTICNQSGITREEFLKTYSKGR